jgi:hypothetical protein
MLSGEYEDRAAKKTKSIIPSKLGLSIIKAINRYLSPHDRMVFHHITKFTSRENIVRELMEDIEGTLNTYFGGPETKKYMKYEDYENIIFNKYLKIKDLVTLLAYTKIKPLFTEKLIIKIKKIAKTCKVYYGEVYGRIMIDYIPSKLMYFYYECYDRICSSIIKFSDSLIIPPNLKYFIIRSDRPGSIYFNAIHGYEPKDIILWCVVDESSNYVRRKVDSLIKNSSESRRTLIINDDITNEISSYIFNTFDVMGLFTHCDCDCCAINYGASGEYHTSTILTIGREQEVN